MQRQRQRRFSAEKISQFQQAFRLCDKDNDGKVDTSQISLLVRSLYQTPSNLQLREWSYKVDPQRTGKFNFNKFLDLMKTEYKQPQTEDELIDAMNSIFKPTSNKISIKQFRNIMSNLGEKLTDDQLNQLFKQLKLQNQQNFNCQEFIKNILIR